MRDILSPEEPSAAFTSVGQLQSLQPTEPVISTVELRASDLDQIQTLLLKGQRREAVRYAISKRLWSHAFILAGSIDKESWQNVVQQFVHAELTGQSDRTSLRMAYGLFAGKAANAGASTFREALLSSLSSELTHTLDAIVDAIVPSAPAPFPPHSPSVSGAATPAPMSRAASPGVQPFASPDKTRFNDMAPQALDSWRDSAAMIFANPTAGSSAALTGLGDLLAAKSRYVAAHVW